MTEQEAGDTKNSNVPTATDNKVGGDMKDSVQAGVIENLNFIQYQEKADLFSYEVNEDERDEVRKYFVAPGNFEQAAKTLADNHVVVIFGIDTGSVYAGKRLLDERACSRIIHLNRERSMDSVGHADLVRGDGYLWALSEQGKAPFTGWEFDRFRHLIESADCRLVIFLNDIGQVPREAHRFCVELKDPNAVEIAEMAINRAWHECSGDPLAVLHEHFTGRLATGVPPEGALHAAELAMRVAEGSLSPENALDEFDSGFEAEIANMMDSSWSTMEYSMMLTVAILQNEPFDKVVREARKLDDQIRLDQLPEDKKLRPRQAFVKPNDQLLKSIRAKIDVRDNPLHKGLKVNTVKFVRKGWAESVLCHIWQQFHIDHNLLLGWICDPGISGRNFSTSVWAIYTLITQIPASDRLSELDRVAAKGGIRSRQISAAVLDRLQEEPSFRILVQQALTEWVSSDSPNRKCAALAFYGLRFERGELSALESVVEIARGKNRSVHNVATGTVLRLMQPQNRRTLVLHSVVSWGQEKADPRLDGLREVALDVGLYLFGLAPDARSLKLKFSLSDLVTNYPNECQLLMREIIQDYDYGSSAILALYDAVYWYNFPTVDAKFIEYANDALAILRLLTSRLDWWHRRPIVMILSRKFPDLRPQIRSLFAMARKIETDRNSDGVSFIDRFRDKIERVITRR